MNHPMIVWCVIAGLLLFAFIFRAAERYYSASRHSDRKSWHILEIGKDKDIFYLPGDVDDDFEDL